ncbi:phage integrase SAM-like domain-containing protein [Domibacillus sp.]|uniref:phage integrase SAM-like domain-containing protein n=1 Tax=Domibacillus sp. TaxID=1969783 RepID=UPI002811D0CE|nr:phage integrase SAM-like domain-containing protein [Domibacillus sp.]
MVKKKRKTQVQVSLSIEKAREVVTRIKKLEGLSKHTLENYQKMFNDLECCFSKRKLVSDFTIEDARRFIDWQLNEKEQFNEGRFRQDKKMGVSIGSANSYLQYAKAAFNTLQDEGYLEENVWESLKNIRRQKEQVDPLSEEEIPT